MDNEYIDPTLVLVVYGDGQYIEEHKIKNNVIGPGYPLAFETLKNITKVANSNELYSFDNNIIPNNVYYFKDNTIIWHCKGQKRKLLLGNEVHDFYYNDIVFKYNGENIFAYYVEDDSKNPNTIVYACFLPNVYGDGSICTGNVNLDKINDTNSYDSIMNEVENIFFNSVFTDFHMNEKYSKLSFAEILEQSKQQKIDVKYMFKYKSLKQLCTK